MAKNKNLWATLIFFATFRINLKNNTFVSNSFEQFHQEVSIIT